MIPHANILSYGSDYFRIVSNIGIWAGGEEFPGTLPSRGGRHLVSSIPGFPFFASGLIGFFQMIRRLGAFVFRAVAHHGVEDAQQSSSHGDVGFWFADASDESLPDRLLAGVGMTKRHGGLADRPTERDRTGLGDLSGLRSSGGLLRVGRDPGPELQGVGVGESLERPDFRGDNASPDLGDAGNRLRHRQRSGESFGTIGENDLSSQPLALPFDQQNNVEQIAEGVVLNGLESPAVREQPALGRGAVELRPTKIGGVENGFHTVLGPAESAGESSPVASELPQVQEFRIGDEAEGALSASQTGGDVKGVVPVGFSSLASPMGQFGGVGNIDAIHTNGKTVNKPLDKTDRLDGHPGRPGQFTQESVDAFDALGVDFEVGDLPADTVDRREGDGGLVQVHADEGGKILGDGCFFGSLVHNAVLRVRGYRRHNFNRYHKRSSRPLHGFTLIELLVVIAIISLLVSILVPSLTKAKELAKQTVCANQMRSFGLAVAQYATENNDSMPSSGSWPSPWDDHRNWIRLLWPYVPSNEDPGGYCKLTPPNAWLCPQDRRVLEYNGVNGINRGSYAINISLTGFYNSAYRQTPYALGDIPSMSTTVLMVERDGDSWAGLPESLQWNSGFNPFPHRHQNGDLFLYLDAHVTHVPNLDVSNDGWVTRCAYREAEEYFIQDKFWY